MLQWNHISVFPSFLFQKGSNYTVAFAVVMCTQKRNRNSNQPEKNCFVFFQDRYSVRCVFSFLMHKQSYGRLPFPEPRKRQGELCRNSGGSRPLLRSLGKTSSWNTVPFSTGIIWDIHDTGYCPCIPYHHFMFVGKQHSSAVDMQAAAPQNEEPQSIWTMSGFTLPNFSRLCLCRSPKL